MGQMRFISPRPERMPASAAERAYLAGPEEEPWLARNLVHGDTLVIERSDSEAGCLAIPWRVAGRGERLLATATLIEREKPFPLGLELARGVLSRFRNQLAQWTSVGLRSTPEIEQAQRRALRGFTRAAVAQADPLLASDRAEEALALACDAGQLLAAEYVRQVLEARRRDGGALAVWWGARLSQPPQGPADAGYLAAFNTVECAVPWREVEPEPGKFDWSGVDALLEWRKRHDLKLFAGPLLQLNPGHVPDWLYLWDSDYDAVRDYTLKFVEAMVLRYRGQVQMWRAAAGMNAQGGLPMTEEQKLRLTALVIDRVRQLDPRAAVLASFDQPFGEYLARVPCDLSPWRFAEALARADLGVSALGLELNLGYWPGGTLPREPLDISRQIDRWSLLGLPLVVYLGLPSQAGPDEAARRRSAKPLEQSAAAGLSPEQQRAWAAELHWLLLGKPAVQGVVWSQWSDAAPHDWPHGGLLDARGVPKPALAELSRLRRAHAI